MCYLAERVKQLRSGTLKSSNDKTKRDGEILDIAVEKKKRNKEGCLYEFRLIEGKQSN